MSDNIIFYLINENLVKPYVLNYQKTLRDYMRVKIMLARKFTC